MALLTLMSGHAARCGREKGPAIKAGFLLLAACCLSLFPARASFAQDSTPPGAVTDLAAATGASGGEITLQWTATGDDGDSGNISGGAFKVHYALAPEMLDIGLAQIERSTDMAAASSQTWKLTGLESGATYFISVWTGDDMGNWSGASNSTQAWAQLSGASAPSAPGEFGGAAVSTISINWTWTDNAIDENGYRLMASTGGIVAALGAGAAGWAETGLSVNTAYSRYAEVYNSTGTAQSPEAAVYTLSLPSSGTYLMSRSSISVGLGWQANGNPAGTRWGVERSSDNFANADTVRSFADGHTALTFLDTGLTAHVTYYYRVLSYNGDGLPGDYDAAVSTLTLSTPTLPANFSGAGISANSIWWTWTDSADEDGYRLRASSGGVVASLAANTVSYVKGGLSINTSYQYYLEAYNSAGSTVTTSTSVYTLTLAPAGSYVLSRSSRSIQLGWYANFNPGWTKYGIERSSNNFASYQLIKGWGDAWTSLNFTDTNLTPYVTYYYRVFSFNGVAFRSAYDLIISTFTLSPPVAPSSFTAVTLSTYAIQWSWNDNSSDEDGYKVKKPNDLLAAGFNRDTTSWLETGLTPNTSHLYYVEAYNTAGTGVSPSTAGYTLSLEPSGTYVVARASNSVWLAWIANGNPAGTAWGIQRSTDGFATVSAVKTFADNFTALNYLDAGLTIYSTYYYRLLSYNLAGAPSAFDAEVSTFTISPPVAPGSFSGNAVSTGVIRWTWTDNSLDELGYLLKVYPFGTVIAALGPDATEYLETGLGVNTQYSRYVEGYNSAGTGASAYASVFTRSLKPSGTYVSARSRQSVRLAWTSGGNPSSTYWGVERSTNNFATSQAVQTFGDYETALGYSETGLTAHTTYYYRVLSYNGNGLPGAYDSIVSTFTISTPTTAGFFDGAAVSTGSILWTWNDNADDEDGYRVKDTTGNVIVVLSSNTNSYLKTGLSANTSYVYLIEAFNSAGWTVTNSSNIFTFSAKPSGAYVVAKTSYNVQFAWGMNGNSSGTRWGIERSTNNFALSRVLKVSTNNFTGTGYLDEGLVADTTYYYRVLSYNGVGYASAWDSAVSTFTLSLPVTANGLAGAALGVSSISWTWTDNAFNEDGYRLKKSGGVVVASLPIGTTYYVETGLDLNNTYIRYVEGYNQAGLTPSAAAAAFTLSAPPSGSYLMSMTSYSAQIGWSLNGNPSGTRWGIERSTDLFVTMQSRKDYDDDYRAMDYLDPELACAATYYYRVRSFNEIGTPADFDSPVYVVTDPAVLPDTVPPSALTDLTAEPGPAVGDLLLSWTSPGDDWWAGATATAAIKIRYKDTPTDFQMSFAQVTISTALAPGASRQYLLSGLTLGVTWYAALWTADNEGYWSDLSNVATGLARVPVVPADPGGFAGAALSSGSVSWTWQDNSFSEDGYRLRSSTGALVAALAAGTSAYLETGLAVDTVYSRYAEAYNFTGTRLSSAASVRTLAATPAGFGFFEVYYSSLALSWSANGNRAGALYRVEYWQAHGSTATILLSTPAAGFSGLEESSTFYFRVGAVNSDGVLSALDIMLATCTRTLPHISTGVTAGADVTLELQQAEGRTSVLVPAGAFGEPVRLTLKTPLAYPPPGAEAPGAPADAGLEILLDKPLQPLKPVTITIGYRDVDIPGMQKNRLVVGRYDPARLRWVLLPSFPDPAARTVTATTSHFSLYRIFEILPSQSVSSPWIFPNPFRPSQGQTTVTFSNLPANSALRIYSVDGNKIRALQCNASGIAYWDGKNAAGREVASGLYLVHTALGPDFGIMKVVVQR